MGATNPLCLDAGERERLLDMSRRLRPAKRYAIALLAIAAVVSIPVYGLAMQAPFLLAALVLGLSQLHVDRARRPEYVIEAVWLFAQLSLVLAIALADGPRIYSLPVLVFPMLVAAASFPARLVALGTAITVLLMLFSGLVLMPSAVAAMPPALALPIALLIVLTLLAARTAGTEEDSRQAVVIDPLTGLLNRSALQARAAELSHHLSAVEGSQVAVILCDVDHFKRINDEQGHAAGDAVLAEAARCLAEVVGHRGSLYRYGGEEFIVLLEGAAVMAAAEVAEEMRSSLRGAPVAGLPVTLSLGVARSSGNAREYASLVAAADRALYRAKAAGRDCVREAQAGEYRVEGVGEAADLASAVERRRAPVAAAPPAAGAASPVPGPGAPSRQRSAGDRSLLCRNAEDREYLVEVVERTTEISKAADPVVAVALIFAGFWVGWLLLVPVTIGCVAIVVINLVWVPRTDRPEYVATFATTVLLFSIGAALLIAGHHPLFALPFIGILMFGQGAALPARPALAIALLDGAVMIAVALLMDAQQVADNPSILVFPLALLGAIALFGHAIGQSGRHHREVATVDPLTGALTRRALGSRVAELEQRDGGVAEPVSILVADLDFFKAVNDEHGHATGDAVLREAAGRLQAGVRAVDSVYRIGGEEFLLLLVGVDQQTALARAERVRRAVGEAPIAGLAMTVSVGVASCPAGEAFAYERLFAAADEALLAAKAGGRDRVIGLSSAASAQPLAA